MCNIHGCLLFAVREQRAHRTLKLEGAKQHFCTALAITPPPHMYYFTQDSFYINYTADAVFSVFRHCFLVIWTLRFWVPGKVPR